MVSVVVDLLCLLSVVGGSVVCVLSVVGGSAVCVISYGWICCVCNQF